MLRQRHATLDGVDGAREILQLVMDLAEEDVGAGRRIARLLHPQLGVAERFLEVLLHEVELREVVQGGELEPLGDVLTLGQHPLVGLDGAGQIVLRVVSEGVHVVNLADLVAVVAARTFHHVVQDLDGAVVVLGVHELLHFGELLVGGLGHRRHAPRLGLALFLGEGVAGQAEGRLRTGGEERDRRGETCEEGVATHRLALPIRPPAQT